MYDGYFSEEFKNLLKGEFEKTYLVIIFVIRLQKWQSRLQNENFEISQNSTYLWLISQLSVPDLFDVCIERCQTDQLECFVSCNNDLICISECIADGLTCTNGEFWILFHPVNFTDFILRLSMSNQLLGWMRWLSQLSLPVWGENVINWSAYSQWPFRPKFAWGSIKTSS